MYNTTEGDLSIQVCVEVVNGAIEVGQTFTTFVATSPGTASAGIIIYSWLLAYRSEDRFVSYLQRILEC